MERRPRKIKKASEINKNLAKNNEERKKKFAKAFPEDKISAWRLEQKLNLNK